MRADDCAGCREGASASDRCFATAARTGVHSALALHGCKLLNA